MKRRLPCLGLAAAALLGPASFADAPAPSWTTYLGGSGSDRVACCAALPGGDVVVAGTTVGDGGRFGAPVAPGEHAFVARIAGDGSAVRWSAILGDGKASAIAVGPDARVYVGGETLAGATFPAAATSFGARGGVDGYVSILTQDGAPAGGFRIGGSGDDAVLGIAVDSAFRIHVTGRAGGAVSGFSGFPVVAPLAGTRAVAPAVGEPFDAFYARIDAALAAQTISLLGGAGDDRGYAVACSADGAVAAIGGFTASAAFSGTADSGTSRGAYSDGFVARFGPDGAGSTSLTWARYVGGYGFDYVNAVAVSGTDIFAAGSTDTGGLATAGAFQRGLVNGDAFCTKLAADGAQRWFTYLGGAGADEARAVSVLASGDVVLAGTAGAGGGGAVAGTFPATLGAHQATRSGGAEAFVARLAGDGATLLASSLLGGPADEAGAAAFAVTGNSVVVAGATSSSAFPAAGALQLAFGGGADDGFVARFALEPGAVSAAALRTAGPTTGAGPESIELRWTPATSGAVTQRVLRRAVTTGVYAAISPDVAPGVGSVTVRNDPAGSVADFVIETVDTAGRSTWSNEVRVNDQVVPPTPEPSSDMPYGPVVTPVGARFHFAWEMATPFDGEFEVEEAQMSLDEVVRSATSRVAGSQRSTKLPSFGPRGSVVRFRVRAITRAGVASRWTDPVYTAVTATRTISWFSATLRRSLRRAPSLRVDAEVETSDLAPWTFNPATDRLILQVGDLAQPAPIEIPAGDFGWRIRGRRAVWSGSRSAVGGFGGRLVIDIGERRVRRLHANLRGVEVSVPEDRSVSFGLRLADEFGLSTGTWTERRPGVLRTFGSN
ncbi:MAG: hypothetical protein K8T90_02835 [Planctomycetes bacterium]|nr:hypothetical protein [Planctomycetota bacterium]